MTSAPDDRTALLSLLAGTTYLLASNAMGHGIYMPPDPRGALLLAAAGLSLFVVAYRHAQRWRERFFRVLQVILALGAFSAVAAFVVADLQEFDCIAARDWGAIPPPQLIFSVAYALASLVALLGIYSVRRRATPPESRPSALEAVR